MLQMSHEGILCKPMSIKEEREGKITTMWFVESAKTTIATDGLASKVQTSFYRVSCLCTNTTSCVG